MAASASTPARRGDGSAGGRREVILRAAAALFAERQDVEAVSVDALAARAGVAKATLYRYFPSKAAIVQALREEHGEAAVQEWQAPDRRQQILAAAMRLIIRQGMRATTMEQIAEAAGISPATIYWHFDSKDDLAMAIAEQCSPLAEVQAALAGGAGGDPRADLMALGRLMLQMLAERLAVIQALMLESAQSPRVAEYVLQQVALPVWMAVAGYLEAHVSAGRLRPAPALPRVFTFAGPIFAFSLGQRALGRALPIDPAQMVDTLVDTFLEGAATDTYRLALEQRHEAPATKPSAKCKVQKAK